MTRRHTFIAILIVAVAASAGCAHSPAARPSEAQDIAAILAFNERYVQAINDGDVATLTGFTTDEHVMISPGRAPLVGKAANDAANRRVAEQFQIAETWTPVETEVAGDWAWQRGTFSVTATPKAGGETRPVTGHYLHIYRRQADGSWRMVRDMFNTEAGSRTN